MSVTVDLERHAHQPDTNHGPELVHGAEQPGGAASILGTDDVRDDTRVGGPGRIVAQLHDEVGEDKGELTGGERQQTQTDDVQNGAGHHPGPSPSPTAHGPVAQPADQDGREQGKDATGSRDAADQEIGVGASDQGGADRDEGDVDRLPVGAAAEPEGIDRGEPPEAESRRWDCADRLNGHPSSANGSRAGIVTPPTT